MYKINNFTYYGINPVKVYDLPATQQKSFSGSLAVVKSGGILWKLKNIK